MGVVKEIRGNNVVAFLDKGSENTVVIGAHYDHLGMGSESSLHRGEAQVHNGADDNASGVAVMVELAERLKNQPSTNNYLFIAFSGEEKGLWGSNYYCKNPTYPLEKVNYMINMDMVGRLKEERTLAINGVGTSPAWMPALEGIAIDSIEIVTTESGVGPSDHTSFYLQDIPVLHFFTGQHEDYHKPSDDVEKINVEGMLSVTDYISELIVALDDDGKLEFTKTKDQDNDDTPRFTVTLGVIPDYLFSGNGMRIDGVSEGKVAEKAGIQKGDVVIQMGDVEVTDMMSYMDGLGKYTSGDSASVTVQRGEEQLQFDIVFE
jgi:Zn-dependent M28 family amino/carboxypeptidase